MKAFPNTNHFDDGYGMDLRDYFAAKVMHAIIVSGKLPTGIMIDTAEEAYVMADHMMKARGQK
jgi:hypothetical protein